jgi:hypothetical protein
LVHIDIPSFDPRAAAALAVAAAVALGLLLALGSVLRDAVVQGDRSRRVTALHWQAVWDCNALQGQDRRQACLAVQAAPADGRPR